MATTYNPNYVPSGPNNRENPYYEKYNHVKIPRAWETREKFLAAAPDFFVAGNPAASKFTRGGITYTQLLWRSSGYFQANAEIPNFRYALGAGGASGGALSNAGGGGGAGAVTQGQLTLPAGLCAINIGAGGVGTINAAGTNGSDSSVVGTPLSVSAQGGGAGGASNVGIGGGCGGGGGTNGTDRAGGAGSVGGNGGASVSGAVTADRAGGGGGGMGGNGANGAPTVGGAGGVGITLSWAEPPMDVAGGGGGAANSNNNGAGTHGGSAGNRMGRSADGVNSGGSGGSGGAGGYQSGNGGNGFFLVVFPSTSANAVIPLFLNEPSAVARGLTISAVGPDNLSFVSDNTDTRRGYSLPIPPAGSVVEFDVTTDNTLHIRLGTSTDLGPTGIINVVPSLAAGTHHVSATVPAYGAEYLWIGFLTQSIGQSVSITNWKVYAV